jgi:hypothetical protein
MLKDIGLTAYFVNQGIFIVLLGLFFLKGLKIARKNFQNKRENKKVYYTLTLSYPFGFIFSFFLIDSLELYVKAVDGHISLFYLFIYWLSVSILGFAIGTIISFYMKRTNASDPEDRTT